MFLNCNLSVNSHAPALRFSSSLPVILWRLLADEPGPATLQSHHLYSARERKEFQEIFWGGTCKPFIESVSAEVEKGFKMTSLAFGSTVTVVYRQFQQAHPCK